MMVLIDHLDDSKGKASEVSQTRDQLRAWIRRNVERLRVDPPSPVGFRRLHEEALDENPEALEGLYMVLLAAGIETSVCLLGNAMALLSERPEWFARLAQEPAMSRLILEEVLRLEPVQQDTVRFAVEDVEVAGCRIRRGQALKLMLSSAGRDESVYASPNDFDPLRNPAGGLPFSAGLHACPGQRFSLLEAEMTLRAIWNRFGAMSRASGADGAIRGASFRRPGALWLQPAMAPAFVAQTR
jgi:cytochrome P450